MALGLTILCTLALLALARFQRRRAKALTRGAAVAFCRCSLRWLSQPYELRTSPCVVFAPHQDDETLGCGGLIARKRNEGLPVHIVFLTDGSASHPGHPALSPADISIMRHQEALAALAVLGVESGAIHFLNVADGTLNTLSPTQEGGLVARLAALLRAIGPGEIFLPCNPDGSTEHDAAFEFICAALQRSGLRPDIWQYPVWSWWNPMLLIERMIFTHGRCRQPTEDFRPIKTRALGHYRTQIEPTAPWSEPALPPELVRIFNSDNEFFFRFIPPPAGGDAADAPVI